VSQNVRRYIYSLGTPVGALLVFYGIASEEEFALWLSLLGAVLLVGEGAMAAAFTPKAPKGPTLSELDSGRGG
jgi:hypothetical protein